MTGIQGSKSVGSSLGKFEYKEINRFENKTYVRQRRVDMVVILKLIVRVILVLCSVDFDVY